MLTGDGTVCTCGALIRDIARHQADNIVAELVSTGVVDWCEMRLGATDSGAPRRGSGGETVHLGFDFGAGFERLDKQAFCFVGCHTASSMNQRCPTLREGRTPRRHWRVT
jgi:hypothetical protein